MCRHLGYLGPERTLHSLIYEGEHSLEHQAYAPRLTQGNLLNADGFGAGWYQDGAAVRFRRAQPLWTDQSFREVAGAVRASCAVAAIRSATVGFPVAPAVWRAMVDSGPALPVRSTSFGKTGLFAGPGLMPWRRRRSYLAFASCRLRAQ